MLIFVQGSDSRFTRDGDGLMCRKEHIDGSLQDTVADALRRAIHCNCSHRITAGHSGTRRVYDNPRRHFYRLHMVSNVQNYVERWESCRRRRAS